MKFMYGFMKDHNSLKNMSPWHERSLSWSNHLLSNTSNPISPNLREDFETNINKTYGVVLPNLNYILLFREKNDPHIKKIEKW